MQCSVENNVCDKIQLKEFNEEKPLVGSFKVNSNREKINDLRFTQEHNKKTPRDRDRVTLNSRNQKLSKTEGFV